MYEFWERVRDVDSYPPLYRRDDVFFPIKTVSDLAQAVSGVRRVQYLAVHGDAAAAAAPAHSTARCLYS